MTLRIQFKSLKRQFRMWLASEPDEVNWLFRFLRKEIRGGVMVDVGAHIGSSLVDFAAANWQIHAFEPDEVNRAKLLWLVTGARNVCVDPRVVSRSTGERVAFYVSPDSTGISSVLPFRSSHREQAKVETVRLEDYLAERGVTSIDFLKIDTEGSELAVLEGMNFGQVRPRAVLCEFDDAKLGKGKNASQALIQLLADQGYEVFLSVWHPLAEYGSGHRWQTLEKWPCAPLAEGCWGNLIAVDRADVGKLMAGIPRKYRLKQ